jgi:putative FmdB family regulatory protein
MPLYEYRCSQCGEQFEKLVRMSDDRNVDCPHCGDPKVQKLVSCFGVMGRGSDGLGCLPAPAGGG